MHTVNGYVVIAFRQSEIYPEAIAILGAREAWGDFEYVTATMRAITDREWHAGHYFQGNATLGRAFEDFRTR